MKFLRFSILLFVFGLVSLRGEDQPVPAIKEFYLIAYDEKRDREVPLKCYLPESEEPLPVVLFSHGLGGSRDNNGYLGLHWAENGYACFFMQHIGTDDSVWKKVPREKRLDAMKGAIGYRGAVARFKDVPLVIDHLEQWIEEPKHFLNGKLDLERIGMSGHSYGAATTQAMMGKKYPLRQQFTEPRIKAYIPMSPSKGKAPSPEKAFGHIEAPVLCMTGTLDSSIITPDVSPESRMVVYQSLPPGDKYHLIFDQGTHMAFSDSEWRNEGRIEHHHSAIQKLSTQFWDAYLKGNTEAKAWLQSSQPHESGLLVEADVWEHK